MGGDPRVLEEQRDRIAAGAKGRLLADEAPGHRVHRLLEDDVGVGVDLRGVPDSELVGRPRQRQQGGSLDRLEAADGRLARRAVRALAGDLHEPLAELRAQHADVELIASAHEVRSYFTADSTFPLCSGVYGGAGSILKP